MSGKIDVPKDLSRSLKSRHVMMIALGGAIGAGMFKGSSESISKAGPSVLFAYIVGGVILLFVMKGLAELTVNHPKAQNFRELIEPILGRFPAHLAGWLYWLDWVLVMAAESFVSGLFLQYWFTTIPVWLMSLIVAVVITLVNLFQVSVYGETEYWLAGIKVAVLSLFVIFGGALLFTGFHGHAPVQFHNVLSHGGLFPNGVSGLASAMLVVMFSFGGTEMIGMTIGETPHPETVIPKAARGVIYRILIFYVLPILVILSLVPWNQLDQSGSPFVAVFEAIGVPFVPDIMNFVMLTAVLSATNTGMYAASRMLYSQALEGQAPKFFAKLSKQGVPVRALLLSTSFLYIGVIVAIFAGGSTFDYLMTIPGYSVMLVWMFLCVTHIRSRIRDGQSAPVSSIIALVALVVIFVGVVLTSPLIGTLVTAVAVALISLSYVLVHKKSVPGQGATSTW